ncbi:MAG: sortase [Anaerolineaceae bacterium]|nr:sortase [Anaerolineaceae bacterium]
MNVMNRMKYCFCFFLIVSVFLILSAAPVFAQEIWGKEVTLPPSFGDGEIPFWAQDTGENLEKAPEPKASFPEKFDLRDKGVITSVKLQDPFSTCWSFGAIGAAESSLVTDGFESDAIDLSEKHLVWFGMHPITEADEKGVAPEHSQLGEGIHVIGESESNPNAAYIASHPILVSSLWSSGVGPLYEEDFPYRGKEGLTFYQFMRQEERWKAWRKNQLIEFYGSEEKLLDVIKTQTDFDSIESYLDWEYLNKLEGVRNGTAKNYYSSEDDWSIPETDENGNSNRNLFSGYTLRDGNMMPAFTIPEYDEKGAIIEGRPYSINPAGMDAVKQELMAGRAVNVGFAADTAAPGQQSSAKFINTETWAHYTYDETSPNHAVIIVGWDDHYAKENFISGEPDRDGNETQPPANGAWIARNSWGRKDGTETTSNGELLGKENWGVDGTGYFYISYYDKSLSGGETFIFDKDFDVEEFYPHQYDFMPAVNGFFTLNLPGNMVISTANVFTAEADEIITQVGTRTNTPNARVTFTLIRLNENYTDPADGEEVAHASATLGFAGFHRLNLDNPVTFKKGEHFAVIFSNQVDVARKDGSIIKAYQLMANAGRSERAITKDSTYYAHAVVNKGESFCYFDNQWQDWSELLQTDEEMQELIESANLSGCEIDNFSVKAYGLPLSDYRNTEGNGSVWVKESIEGLDFTFKHFPSDIDTFRKFDHAAVDNVPLDKTSYSVKEGSVIVSLTPDYLSTLAVGIHTIEVFFTDGGSASAVFTVFDSSTDDDGPVFLRLSGNLPATGFSSFHRTVLREQPLNLSYKPVRMSLQIPALNVEAELVSVPLSGDFWQVDWLGQNAGVLEGSALPGEGISIVAAHNTLSNMEFGPFALLSTLELNDVIMVSDQHGGMQRFRVFANELLAPDDMAKLAAAAEQDQNTLVLITCENELPEGGYLNRRVVFAKPAVK